MDEASINDGAWCFLGAVKQNVIALVGTKTGVKILNQPFSLISVLGFW